MSHPELEAEASRRDGAVAAVMELRTLVARLTDEVAGFRRRALQAERRVKEMEGVRERTQRDQLSLGEGTAVSPERVAELERENAELRRRMNEAMDRTRQLLHRTRFLRQQEEGRA